MTRIYVSGTSCYFYNNGGTSTGSDAADNLVTGTSVTVRCSIMGWYPVDPN